VRRFSKEEINQDTMVASFIPGGCRTVLTFYGGICAQIGRYSLLRDFQIGLVIPISRFLIHTKDHCYGKRVNVLRIRTLCTSEKRHAIINNVKNEEKFGSAMSQRQIMTP
jgi:hypothetical protein